MPICPFRNMDNDPGFRVIATVVFIFVLVLLLGIAIGISLK